MSDIALQISVAADADAVRRAVTSEDGIAGWFTTGIVTEAGVQRLAFPGQPAPWEFKVTEDSTERVGMSVVAGPPNWIGTVIGYGIEATEEGALLRFDHTGFAAVDDDFRRTGQTWATLLSGMKTFLETGKRDPLFTAPVPGSAEGPLSDVARTFADAVRGIPAERLNSATPCAEFTVADLLGHLAGTLAAAGRAARKERQVPEAGPAEPGAVAEAALAAAAAWAAPGALDGDTEFGPGAMPARAAAGVVLQELALHGWDLARATGRDYLVGPAAGAAVLAVVEQLAPQARSAGGYGPARTPADGADTFTRALAASGRDTSWHPHPSLRAE